MGGTGDVEHQAIRRIEGDERGVALGPVGDGREQGRIGGSILVDDVERRDHGAGIGERLADGEAEPLGRLIQRDEAERALDLGDDRERGRHGAFGAPGASALAAACGRSRDKAARGRDSVGGGAGEGTRVMVPLQIEAAGQAEAVALEREAEGRTADAGLEIVERAGRMRRGLPAGQRRARLGRGAWRRRRPMTPLSRARRARRRLAVRSSRRAADLGKHGGEPAAGKALLEDPERLARPADADDDQCSQGDRGDRGPAHRAGPFRARPQLP